MKNGKLKKILIGLTMFAVVGYLSSVEAQEKKLKVVTTVAPITNIVKNISGSLIDLHGIIPEGMDSHTFEPIPSDVKYLVEADLLIVNGLHLETPTEDLAKANMKKGGKVLRLGDNTINQKEWVFDFSFPEQDGNPNPHLWLNVAHAMRYAELTRDALSQLDPAHKADYEANTKLYLAKLDALDKGIMEAMKTVPPKNRKLLTYHDSFAYFCPRYGCTVIGAIQPSDFSQPSPREVAAIIDQLRKEQVPAIFGSDVYPSKVEDQIAEEIGVKHVTTLRDDDLPGPFVNSPEHTYVGMMLENIRTMVTVLGGKADALKGIDPANVAK